MTTTQSSSNIYARMLYSNPGQYNFGQTRGSSRPLSAMARASATTGHAPASSSSGTQPRQTMHEQKRENVGPPVTTAWAGHIGGANNRPRSAMTRPGRHSQGTPHAHLPVGFDQHYQQAHGGKT